MTSYRVDKKGSIIHGTLSHDIVSEHSLVGETPTTDDDDVIMNNRDGTDDKAGEAVRSLLSSEMSGESLPSSVHEGSTGPSLELDKILTVPRVRTREEIEEEEEKVKAFEDALRKTSHIENVLGDVMQEHLRHKEFFEGEIQKLASNVQLLLEQQSSRNAKAEDTGSIQNLENMVRDAVSKAGDTMKTILSKVMRDNIHKKICQAEERLSLL